MRIKKDLPCVQQIYVQYNNEKCYKTPELVFDMFEIARQKELELIFCIYTGVKDGKVLIMATSQRQ